MGPQRVGHDWVTELNWIHVYMYWLPWWLSGKESACQCRRLGFNPWVRKILWRRKCVHVCVQLLQSCPALCNPMVCSPPGSSVLGFPRQECWSGLPRPPPGDPANAGSNPHPLHCRWILYPWANWVAQEMANISILLTGKYNGQKSLVG